jgi:hypothetical protein
MLVDETNQVLVGNGLLQAMRQLDRDTGDIVRMTGLSDAEKTKLMLSDNKIYELGIDDYQSIMALARGLDDLDIPGFDAETLTTLIAGDNIATAAAEALGEDEKTQDGLPVVRAIHIRGETKVTCPYCGKEFRLMAEGA